MVPGGAGDGLAEERGGGAGEGKVLSGRSLESDGRSEVWAGAVWGQMGDVLSECMGAVRVCVKASVVAHSGEPKSACPWDRQTLQLGAFLRSRPLPQAEVPKPPKR